MIIVASVFINGHALHTNLSQWDLLVPSRNQIPKTQEMRKYKRQLQIWQKRTFHSERSCEKSSTMVILTTTKNWWARFISNNCRINVFFSRLCLSQQDLQHCLLSWDHQVYPTAGNACPSATMMSHLHLHQLSCQRIRKSQKIHFQEIHSNLTKIIIRTSHHISVNQTLTAFFDHTHLADHPILQTKSSLSMQYQTLPTLLQMPSLCRPDHGGHHLDHRSQ